ncbi:MAG: SpoIIE family protein phosphatase [Acidobacteriota bacterium]
MSISEQYLISDPPAQSRLLVVDDNEMNRDMLSRRLIKRGHLVEVAVDGRDALNKLRAGAFDLVLLDIMMPEMDGFEVLETLKADPGLCHIPVVMISASEETASVVRCIELGADDYLPKPFNPVILKARVDASLEKKRLRDRERLYALSMERELEIGRKIQSSFFPERIPFSETLEIAAAFTPARQVAGDFYDAFALSDGRMALVVADVCDKGVGAALFMALFRTLIRAISGEQSVSNADTETVLLRTMELTNNYIAETHGSSNMFATVFFATIDPGSGHLAYVNGGHDSPLLIRRGEIVDRLAPTGPALGLLPGSNFTVAEMILEERDILLAYTDGVTEARGPGREFYGESRLVELVEHSWSSAAELVEALDGSVRAHIGETERSDDITILAVRTGSAAGKELR